MNARRYKTWDQGWQAGISIGLVLGLALGVVCALALPDIVAVLLAGSPS